MPRQASPVVVCRQDTLPRRSSRIPPAAQARLADDLLRVDRRALADESLQIVHGIPDRHANPLRPQVKGQEGRDVTGVFDDSDPGIPYSWCTVK